MTTENPLFAQARARHALRMAGFDDPKTLERASSTRNEVFLSPDLVVRVNRHPNQRLRREALLCRHLPDAPWAPDVLAYGGEVGADYLIVRRRPGAPLSRWWPDLSSNMRRDAVRQLCTALAVLHETQTPVHIPRIDNSPHLIDPRNVTPLVPLLLAIEELTPIDPGLFADVLDYVHHTADALSEYSQRTLIHGDLSFENLLWNGAELTGILDFEWCRGAPLDLELDVLFRFCAFPHAHVAPDYEARTLAADYVDVPVWVAEDRPDLFEHPALFERLMLYAISFSVQELISHPLAPNTPRAILGPMHPICRLANLLHHGGHLTATLQRIGLPV
ncbi:MAG: aminoglycoside phosphotransferase family protein [Acidimicrobiales bacterium]